MGVSSAGVDWVVDQIVAVVANALPVLMITKGLVPKEASIEVFPGSRSARVRGAQGLRLPVMAVGGPCIAGELAAKRDAGVVITGDDETLLSIG